MRKAFRAAGLLAVTAALVSGVAIAAAGPSATITSPTAGEKISARHTSYLALAGTAAFATPAAATTRFYLRRDGCGTSSDNPHLSDTSGTDGGDGCGLVLTIVGVGGTADQGAFVDYPSTDGMPLTAPDPSFLDARDGILSADLDRYHGDNTDLIWSVFARRSTPIIR